jgi:transposase
VPALPPYIIEPIWEQFVALLPPRKADVHPLGCHRHRVPDRLVFDKLVQVLVFGCAYERIADESCSATTLRRRRDEWIDCGVMEKLREMVCSMPTTASSAWNSRTWLSIAASRRLPVAGRWREGAL